MIIKNFGNLSNGETASLYILNNKDMEISVTDFGTSLVSLKVPDRHGQLTDIVLGYDDVTGYEKDATNYIGCNVGRNANRIAHGCFEYNNKTYILEKNAGNDNLHSGYNPYSKRLWTVEYAEENKIIFSLLSPHLDQGFPGNIKIFITYELLPECQLKITYSGTPDADTILNITNHSYFNLNGHGNGNCFNHTLSVNADYFTPSNAHSITTGEIESVVDTPMDFRTGKDIGRDIDKPYLQLIQAQGYDHNWCIRDYDGSLKNAVNVSAKSTGISMSVSTDYPGIQIYTSNYLNNVHGKNGVLYHKRCAVCFEPQFFPNAIQHKNFVSPICKAGQSFHKEIIYKFDKMRR